MFKKMNNQSGMTLLTVIIFTIFLFVLCATYMEKLAGEKRMTLATQEGFNATNIADAVAEEVFWRYNYNNFSTNASGNGWSTGAGSCGSATSACTGSVSTPITFTDTSGTTVGNYYATIAAYATAPILTVNTTYTGGTEKRIGNTAQILVAYQAKPKYPGAVLAKGLVTLSGNGYTDSYDSAAGVYGGSNINANGDIVTNSASSTAVSWNGSCHIEGDAVVGVGGGVTDSSDVSGIVSASANETISDVTYSTSAVDAGTLTTDRAFTAGTYQYTAWSLGGGDDITITGDVIVYLSTTGTALSTTGNANVTIASGSTLTIYTKGNIDMGGTGIVNNNGSSNPDTLIINGTSTCTSVSLGGNSALTGLINTPYAAVSTSGSTTLNGAIICDTASLGQPVHYDEDLLINGPTNGWELKWYRKIR